MVENKYFVTDAHCHIYPEKIASRAVGEPIIFIMSIR